MFLVTTGSWDSEHCGVGDPSASGRDLGEVFPAISVSMEILVHCSYQHSDCWVHFGHDRMGDRPGAGTLFKILHFPYSSNPGYIHIHIHHLTSKHMFLVLFGWLRLIMYSFLRSIVFTLNLNSRWLSF